MDWIINTPAHKRWWLPDGRHQYNSNIFGDTLRICVIDSYTQEQKHIAYIKLEGNWEDLSQLSQELAAKRYPRQLRHKSKEWKR